MGFSRGVKEQDIDAFAFLYRLADNDLLSQRRAAPGEGADAQGRDLILTTPWTEKGYALSLRSALVEETA